MIDSLVSVLSFFQKNKIDHGDIRPANILLTKNGVLKIADINLINDDNNIYYKLFSHTYVENHYVSPQLMESLKKNLLVPQYDICKNDVYSFGMTILEAATLDYSSFCYDYDTFNVDISKIKSRLESLKLRYSDFFVNFLSDILQEKEKNRPNFQDIYLLLLPFQTRNSKNQGFKTNRLELDQVQKVKKGMYPNKSENPKANEVKKNGFDKENSFKLTPKITILDENLQKKTQNKIWSNSFKKEALKKEKPLSIKDKNIVLDQEEIYSNFAVTREQKEVIPPTKKEEKIEEAWEEENQRLNDIEKKINEALRLSEQTIKMHGIFFI